MNSEDLKNRTKKYALDIIHLCKKLPDKADYKIIKDQLMRSSLSIGANYRAACRAKSNSDFIYKLKIVEEEADESAYFLEILKEMNVKQNIEINTLLNEVNELVSIIVSSIKTIKKKYKLDA